jgi:galactose mutarotase-like enzyme
MQREHVLKNGNTTVGVMPDINLISHFQVGDWPVLYRATETGNVKRWGLPLMIPNFSRLKNGIFEDKGTSLPTHGFGRDLPWTVIGANDAQITLQLQSSETTRSAYPYEFTFTVALAISEGVLTYTLTMENRNDEVMPIAPGFHPYFSVAQKDKAAIKVHGLPTFDAHAINWETQPPDTHFPFSHQVTVDIPHHGVLTIAEQPVANKYSLSEMQVWSEPATAPDHNFICFEPVVTYENGLNRPHDRLNIPPQSSHQLVLELRAQPHA